MSFSSLHTFDQVKINGSLTDQNGEPIVLADLVSSSDLSSYALSSAVDSSISTALESYTATADMPTAVSDALTNLGYPTVPELIYVSGRMHEFSNFVSTDDTPQQLTLFGPAADSVGHYDITVIARSHGANMTDKEAFSSKFSVLVVSDSSNNLQYQLINGEQKESRLGAVGWTVSLSESGQGGVAINVKGAADKNIIWKAVIVRDDLAAQAL